MEFKIAMQASMFFVLCAAVRSSSSPTPANTTTRPTSPAFNISSANITNTTSTSAFIPNDWHGQPYCTPTGEGYCNFAFYWFEGPDGRQFDSLFVYDRSCNVIGWQTGVDILDFEVYSQLPYVVVGEFSNLFDLVLTFKYAGRSYGDNCYDYCGISTCTSFVKQCAFKC